MEIMEKLIVGIDLGTTNSVVAVPGQHSEKGNVFGNTTVVGDEYGRLTHASAVCMVDGELIVGDDAKMLASEGYTPVRFVKKYMGTDRKSLLGDKEKLPEEISAEVIRHMCKTAGKAFDAEVEAAVITHPAYFDGAAIGATKEAGALAGIRVASLLMEPIAAAMAFTQTDDRPRLRLLVYDLGGGTFDITLVERSGSTFRAIGFGGDRELGGYNFDKKIAMEMLSSLRDKGYNLDIDSEQPDRDSRWAALMHHAEQLKFKLSPAGANKGDIRVPNVFRDDSSPPKSVNLTFSMSRIAFLELIEPEIAKTMYETRKVLDSKQMAAADVDYLLMVGGSSRIEAIHERLKQEFGLDAQTDENILDLSVAVGAAMVAAAIGTTQGGVKLNTIPAETDAPILPVAGEVLATDDRPNVADFTVTLSGGMSGDQETITSADGRFYLETELFEDSENELRFSIVAPDGTMILEQTYQVTHVPVCESGQVDAPPPILSKPITVATVDGFSVLASEGVNLPFKATKPFQTAAELTEIPVDIYQEDIQLTTILLTGFDRPVPANCRVELEIGIGPDYQLRATASVPSASISKSQEVQLPRVAVPPLTELRWQFKEYRQQYESALENIPDGEQKARVAAEADRLIEEIEELLADEFVEDLQAYMLIKKFQLLTTKLKPGGLQPSQSEMNEKLTEARRLLPQAIAKEPALRDQNIEATLDALERESHRAYQENDSRIWSQIARKVDEVIAGLNATVHGPIDLSQLPPAPLIAQWARGEINKTRQTISQNSASMSPDNVQRANQELDTAESKLEQVNLADDEAAKREIIILYQQHVKLAEQLAGISSEGPAGILREIR